jgi:hypothetical protein
MAKRKGPRVEHGPFRISSVKSNYDFSSAIMSDTSFADFASAA